MLLSDLPCRLSRTRTRSGAFNGDRGRGKSSDMRSRTGVLNRTRAVRDMRGRRSVVIGVRVRIVQVKLARVVFKEMKLIRRVLNAPHSMHA
jgi:hypothetical protein